MEKNKIDLKYFFYSKLNSILFLKKKWNRVADNLTKA